MLQPHPSPPPPDGKRRSAAGFTLIELIATVLVVAIVTTLALPAFRDYAAGESTRAQLSDLAGAVRLGRTEAIKRGRVVTLCRTDDATVDAPTCADGTDWSTGWVLRQGEVVIRVQPAYRDSGGIETGIQAIRFLPTGISLGAADAFTFRPKLPTTSAAYERLTRRICISANGVTRNC